MNRPARCAKCASTDMIADAKVIDRGHHYTETDLSVATHRKPQALLFKGQVTTTVSAWVCGACGFIELYADDPSKIRVTRAD